MDILTNVVQVLLILTIVYLWNRFIVKFLIQKVVNFQKKYNSENLNSQPIKFFVENELSIIKFGQSFYWFGAIFICFNILFN